MSDSVEYMKKQAAIALENGDKQSSAVLTLCAGFLETVEEADSLRTQLADATRKLEEARKNERRYVKLRELVTKGDLIGTDDHQEFDNSIDQAIEQGKGGNDAK